MVDEFTEPLPRKVMACVLGVPPDFEVVFSRFSEALIDALITRPQAMDPKQAQAAVAEGLAALTEVIGKSEGYPPPICSAR